MFSGTGQHTPDTQHATNGGGQGGPDDQDGQDGLDGQGGPDDQFEWWTISKAKLDLVNIFNNSLNGEQCKEKNCEYQKNSLDGDKY